MTRVAARADVFDVTPEKEPTAWQLPTQRGQSCAVLFRLGRIDVEHEGVGIGS